MDSRNASGSASRGVMSLKRIPGLGKSGMSRIYALRSIVRLLMQRRIRIHFHGGNRMSLSIRRGVPADADLVADMNARMALETEGKALDQATVAAGVRAVLSDASRGLY